MNRQIIFSAVRTMLARGFTPAEVEALDRAISDAIVSVPTPVPSGVPTYALSLIKEFEGCKLSAYPDPGSGGDPWTIGWGSTGEGIRKGVTWTQAQADARLESDVAKFTDGVRKIIGAAPATDRQLGAMISLAYNIGLGAFKESTLLRLHKEGDYTGAANQFTRWVKAAGKTMAGLVRRREAEAKVYRA